MQPSYRAGAVWNRVILVKQFAQALFTMPLPLDSRPMAKIRTLFPPVEQMGLGIKRKSE
jgi:hypothetical protein